MTKVETTKTDLFATRALRMMAAGGMAGLSRQNLLVSPAFGQTALQNTGRVVSGFHRNPLSSIR